MTMSRHTEGVRARLSAFLNRQLSSLSAPFREPERRLFLVIFGFILGVTFGFLVGARYFGDQMVAKRQLVLDLNKAEAAIQQMSLSNAELKTTHKVDTLAMENLSGTLFKLEDSLAATSEELRLYKSLMGDYGDSDLPFVRAVKLSRNSSGGVEYRLIIEQGKRYKGKNASVQLLVMVAGQKEGKPADIPMTDLDAGFPGEDVEIPVRYFKVLEGVLELPDGFSPEYFLATSWIAGQRDKESSETRLLWRLAP